MTSCLELSLPAIPISVRRARDEVAEIAAGAGADGRVVDDVRLCVSEAATNVVRHAYDSDVGSLVLSVDRAGDELTVVVSDSGIGLSEFRREGDLGYGLRIIEELTDRCTISNAPEMGTEVQMVFQLEPMLAEWSRTGEASKLQ